MENHQKHLFLFILQAIFLFPPISCATYNVQNFGAKGDGVTDSTKAFLSAWAVACNSTTTATINVPGGMYLLGYTVFAGNKCKSKYITFKIDGTFVAPADHNALSNSGGNWIKFQRVNGLSVYGGTLDGQGTGLWACKTSGDSDCPTGAKNLAFYNSNNVFVSGLTSFDSQKVHILLEGCKNTTLDGIKISAHEDSPNTDGIHVMSSSGNTFKNFQIATGDDCISIGPGTSNLWIENILCGPGHGISIGSLGWTLDEPGVENVTIKTTTFTNTENGYRIKTWAQPSNGFVKGVLFQNARMVNVKNPVIIDQYYCPSKGCLNKVSGVKISDVTFQNVFGTCTTPVGVKLKCSIQNPCSNIILDQVNLSYKNMPATASCTNAGGSSFGVVQPNGCLK